MVSVYLQTWCLAFRKRSCSSSLAVLLKTAHRGYNSLSQISKSTQSMDRMWCPFPKAHNIQKFPLKSSILLNSDLPSFLQTLCPFGEELFFLILLSVYVCLYVWEPFVFILCFSVFLLSKSHIYLQNCLMHMQIMLSKDYIDIQGNV